jgi:hypothetical protein
MKNIDDSYQNYAWYLLRSGLFAFWKKMSDSQILSIAIKQSAHQERSYNNFSDFVLDAENPPSRLGLLMACN